MPPEDNPADDQPIDREVYEEWERTGNTMTIPEPQGCPTPGACSCEQIQAEVARLRAENAELAGACQAAIVVMDLATEAGFNRDAPAYFKLRAALAKHKEK